MSTVVLFAYPIKFNISTTSKVTKILQKKLYCKFKLSFQCTVMKKILDKISFREHFKVSRFKISRR